METRDKNYIVADSTSRATIVTIHVKDDSRVRESVAVLRFVVAWGGPPPYPFLNEIVALHERYNESLQHAAATALDRLKPRLKSRRALGCGCLHLL